MILNDILIAFGLFTNHFILLSSTLNLIKCLSILKDYNFIKFSKNNLDEQNCHMSNINNLIKEVYKRMFIPFYIPWNLRVILNSLEYCLREIEQRKIE